MSKLKSILKKLEKKIGKLGSSFGEFVDNNKPGGDSDSEDDNDNTISFGNSSLGDKTKAKQPKIPNDETYYKICVQSYNDKKKRPFVIRQYWRYLNNHSTNTICAYLDELNKVIVLCFRGTKPSDLNDLMADKDIAFNRLNQTKRFKTDVLTTQQLLEDFDISTYSYFLCGHSLGQAMFLEMDRTFNKFSFGGRGFNGALQPKDIILNPKKFSYWYIKGDPLYRLSGRLLRKGLTVFASKSEKTLQNHSLENFDGLTERDKITKGGGRDKLPSNSELNKIGFPSNIQKQYRLSK